MIIFYSDNFQLNLTTLNITFVKENALFFDAFYKNYTLPFTMPIDSETSQKLGLLDLNNTSNYTVKHYGKLFMDSYFDEAYLFIEVEEDNIQGSIAFGKLTIPLLDTKLADLPFPIIKTTSINNWAKEIKTKQYPDVSHCFPLVFDDEFHNTTNYDAFEGVVNNTDGVDFVTNVLDVPSGDIFNKNIVVPFPYVMSILKQGFNSASLDMIGDFVNTEINNHLILNTKKHLESFSSTTYQLFQFKNHQVEFTVGSDLIYQYNKTFDVTAIGTYEVKILLNLPVEINIWSIKVLRGSEELFAGASKSLEEVIQINTTDESTEFTVQVRLELYAHGVDIENFNSVEFQKNEGKLNVFKDTFSLSEVMPDITFGAFLNKIKNWLNLKVSFQDAYVRLDYVETQITNIQYKDESAFEIETPQRNFNQAKIYRLKYNDDTLLYVNKTGRVGDAYGYRDDDIKEIDINLTMLPIEEREGIFTALRGDDDFQLMLYQGPDVNGYPVAVEKINGFGFSLNEVFDKYWSKWLQFRTNSETYKDTFTTHSLEEFDIDNGRFKYNKKHIYKTIKQTRLSETEWKVEVESETL
jgi:hypothetical protein